MPQSLTTKDIYQALQQRFALHWVAARQGAGRIVLSRDQHQESDGLVGPLNCIHPNRIQLMGRREQEYLDRLGPNSYSDSMELLFAGNPAAIIYGDDLQPGADIVQRCQQTDTPLLRTPETLRQLAAGMQVHLYRLLQPRLTLHGVLMDVMGIGVLLIGDSAVGKSELALELITRGHRLIADDAPQFSRIGPDVVEGSCPALLWEFLEVRGLGILNVRAMFGDAALKPSKYLRLIIQLQATKAEQLQAFDRIQGERGARDILGVDITTLTLPVLPGRNLAVMVEVAVRDHILRMKGYNASEHFVTRQGKAIEANSSCS